MPDSIIELYPVTRADGHASIVRRVSREPRDLASIILAWLYCLLGSAQVSIAIAAAVIAGVYLQPQQWCLLEDNPLTERRACYLTYVACGLTVPISVGVMATEALPSHLVSPGTRNVLPLVLLIMGTIIWGVQAALLHRNEEEGAALLPGEHWRSITVGLSWSNMGLFLSAAVMKLLSPALASCIDSTSICLGRCCPEGCMPACDACCCLDVRDAKVPRDVMRQGRVTVRYLSWNRELVDVAPGTLVGMSR